MIAPGQDPGTPLLRRAPAERWAARVLPGGGALLAAAEGLHMAGVHATVPAGGVSALSAAVAWGMAGRGRAPESLPWWIAVEGAWFAAAEALGPLATWHHVPYLAAVQLAVTLAARRAAHRSDSVTAARDWREQRAGWLGRSHEWGLGGTHLIDFEYTRLGELYTVSTKGTGKLAPAYCTPAHEGRIAECEDLLPGRVQIWCRGLLAGRIKISVRRVDPWAEPLLHPLACDEHEVELPEERSILDPAIVGQDPETGAPLEVPLYDEVGGKNVSVTGIKGAGKGVLLDNLCEWVTGCYDAVPVRLNVSVKGYAEAESWGPACHLTAFGPEEANRAVAVLEVLGKVIEWRARNFKRGQYAPSAEHPAFVVFLDESDSAFAVPALRALLNMLATKGREYGIVYIHAGQRNTRDYNDPKAKSQDDVRCTGMVANANESRHAGSTAGPDMATYGEGCPGVWKVEVLGRGVSCGRTWVFHPTPAGHGAEVERIAQERAYSQPELTEDCREYLGKPYAALLADEVFARWAREQDPDAHEPEDDGGGDKPGTEAPEATPPGPQQEPDAGTETAAPAGRTAVAERDPFDKWLEMDVADNPDTDARSAAIRARLTAAGQEIGELAARPRPEGVSGEVRDAYVDERWRQVIPAGARPRLLEMLEGTGTTSGEVAEEFGINKSRAKTWLVALRREGIAYVDGERRGARTRLLAPPPAGGDAP